MQKLSIEAIINNIKSQQTFHAVAEDYSFTIKIEEYVPYVCAAIHDGHQFRKELWDNCLHTEYDRWYEEDPETKNMIISHPIVIAGCDSRFEYDLNRAPEDAVFETAWGKQLWRLPLPEEHKLKSLSKHKAFYNVTYALIESIEAKFGAAIVYDMHSYNWKRWDREVPTWNLGTSNVDNNRFGEDIELWRQSLSEIQLPNNIKSTALINNTFFGNGYFLKFITNSFKNTLVLATEIAKVYCDECEQINFPEVAQSVENQLKKRLPIHAKTFIEKHSK
ncbi:N-formylglutamate amidohydrolase [Pontimicrobium sp. SW4]|uniref:N-formylglutamate amidohydrolase n=1 Tax=Pontimicrobium sp. SW4 TaxID=3153519 RepID=A0AAU7BWS2_9FLAO